ncbi:PadR family transcriptional regulator [Lacrimispora saccharolytica]|uniref:Transcriptional regulator, PadR-like family n=1 Tax=Lacrimispora saccharolytica (strain ATCC 35040 / DSM 2544 / NRCC 2533 / WM1) TaxID=610130 RepID=D9R1W2_LACSW|nr:helix-turn-helix transcriptional regulator [Lacrimispora saccharolytica]ADL02853.1 transcriptional regulator, PadR-like family [[Clostridium] saccharolyticum WM1]QRV18945.1 helix-turn-helix transcriptional regulator [Lacrimispora saccharolytica]
MDKRYMALGTSMLVLKLLKQQSMYGYQIIRELEQQSRNVFQLQEGTLYPILHTLEQQGAVTSYQQTADNGRLRKYYAITSHGLKLLDEKLDEWKVYQTAINQVIGGVLFE